MSLVVAFLMGRELSQVEFAQLVGVSEARVSQLVSEGVIVKGQNAHEWLVSYIERLRDQAAGRDPDGELASARTSLAREQALGHKLANAKTQGEFAAVGLLADILGSASAALAERLEALPSRLRTVCPDLPEAARAAIEQTLAAARNEWLRATGELTDAKLEALAVEEADDEAASGP